MSPRETKSKNLGIYPFFFNYDNPSDIPFVELAQKLAMHPNRLRGMIRPARRNTSIYIALRKKSYSDSQIPSWFARPDKPLAYGKAAPAGPKPSAEKRSGAEGRSEPRTGYSHPTIDGAQKGSAQRPSGLSACPALPSIKYRLARPVYQPPMNPLIKEVLGQIREIQDEEMRASLDREKRRRDPPMPVSFEGIKALADAYKILRQIEIRDAFQTMSLLSLIQEIRRTSASIDVEELKELLSRPFKELGSNKERERQEMSELVAAVGYILEVFMPRFGPDIDLVRRDKVARQRKLDDDWEAILDISETLVERRRRKNVDLQMLKDQNRKIVEDFWKKQRM